jgi:hypothetical protein
MGADSAPRGKMKIVKMALGIEFWENVAKMTLECPDTDLPIRTNMTAKEMSQTQALFRRPPKETGAKSPHLMIAHPTVETRRQSTQFDILVRITSQILQVPRHGAREHRVMDTRLIRVFIYKFNPLTHDNGRSHGHSRARSQNPHPVLPWRSALNVLGESRE